MLVLFLSFAEGLYLGFEVFQMLLLAFPEGTLGSSVLSLAFLFAQVSSMTLEQRSTNYLQ